MKTLKRILIAILAIVLIMAIAFLGWATLSAQEATGQAVVVLEQNGIQREDGMLVFRPDSPNGKGLIYYPGGLVDPEAYAVTAQGVADAGYLVVVPKMPLNLAFTGINRADGICEDFPEVTSWVIGGHSLGGAMAAEYAKNNTDTLDGLIFFASYPANYDEFVDFAIPILSISASNDPGIVEQQAFYEVVSESATRVIIEGGNHRQYADYAFQNDDGVPTITAAEQQSEIIEATVAFMDSLD